MSPVDELGKGTNAPNREEVPLVITSILRPEGTTGVHTHIRELRWYLDQQRLSCELITPFSWGRSLSTPVFALRKPLVRVAPAASVAWYRHWHTVFLARALRGHLSRLGPCVIYAQGPEAARASLMARAGPHQRVIMAVHFLRSQADGWVTKGHIRVGGRTAKAIELSERTLDSQLDGIVYVSSAAKHHFLAAAPGATSVPSAVVPNFVRGLATPPHSEPLGDLVTVGGLELVKNQQFILRVLAVAKAAGKEYTLDIYGTGPLRAPLQHLAAQFGLAGQVRLRGYDPKVRTYLPSYRAYVHSCPVETGPLALIEALAAGLPIIAGARGGVPELVTDTVEGRYWPLDDPAAAAGILIALLDDEAARMAASQAASLRFKSHFEATLVVPSLMEFLNKCPPRTSGQTNASHHDQSHVTRTETQRAALN